MKTFKEYTANTITESESSAMIKKDLVKFFGSDPFTEYDLKFKSYEGTLGKYFSSIRLTGKITKLDAAKGIFVFEYDNFRMNDGTMGNGPGGEIKSYKTTFRIDDIDSIEERNDYFTIDMKQ